MVCNYSAPRDASFTARGARSICRMKYFDVLDALRNDDILNTVYRHIRREAYFLTSILGI